MDRFGSVAVLANSVSTVMARRARLIHPGFPLHIIQRGNNRSSCFLCDTDYRVYLSMLRNCAYESRCAIHAYVLMTNHVHLLVTPPVATAAASFMKALGQQYVQYINRRHGRTGSLWEGRFRSSIVQDDSYFLTCQRYIELNPVRAGMVDDPQRYAWSSYHANAYGHPDVVLTPHDCYIALGEKENDRSKTYRGLFSQPIGPDVLDQIRSAANGNFVFGNADFKAEVAARLGCYTTPQGRGQRRG